MHCLQGKQTVSYSGVHSSFIYSFLWHLVHGLHMVSVRPSLQLPITWVCPRGHVLHGEHSVSRLLIPGAFLLCIPAPAITLPLESTSLASASDLLLHFVHFTLMSNLCPGQSKWGPSEIN